MQCGSSPEALPPNISTKRFADGFNRLHVDNVNHLIAFNLLRIRKLVPRCCCCSVDFCRGPFRPSTFAVAISLETWTIAVATARDSFCRGGTSSHHFKFRVVQPRAKEDGRRCTPCLGVKPVWRGVVWCGAVRVRPPCLMGIVIGVSFLVLFASCFNERVCVVSAAAEDTLARASAWCTQARPE